MLDLHRAGMVRQHVGKSAISLRRLIEAAADKAHALAAQPGLHLVVTYAARLAHALAGCRILDEPSTRFRARHDAPGAVHGRVQGRCCRRALDAGENDGIVAHGAADKAALPRKGGRRPLAHHPQLPIAVALAPGVVVMVMDAIEHLAADDRAHALDHPFAAGISPSQAGG